jgi:CheY-like chemotaxis protein
MSVSILVVDDEPDVVELFRFRREERRGTYMMHFADSGEAALERLPGNIEPALIAVLSDINMPGMDGLQLLSEIKHRWSKPMATMSDAPRPASWVRHNFSATLSISTC